jgi:hypothetical protein
MWGAGSVAQLFEVEQEIYEREQAEYIQSLISQLPERACEVLRLRYTKNCTLSEIGDQLGVGKERVRQIEAGAIRKLRWAASRGLRRLQQPQHPGPPVRAAKPAKKRKPARPHRTPWERFDRDYERLLRSVARPSPARAAIPRPPAPPEPVPSAFPDAYGITAPRVKTIAPKALYTPLEIYANGELKAMLDKLLLLNDLDCDGHYLYAKSTAGDSPRQALYEFTGLKRNG